MKSLHHILIGVTVLFAVAVLATGIAATTTRNHTSTYAAALDNLNPWVQTESVYTSTNVQPDRHYIGGGGEDEYVYTVSAINAQGKKRTLRFESQWQLKPNHHLHIVTKGQNVESWQAIALANIPVAALRGMD